MMYVKGPVRAGIMSGVAVLAAWATVAPMSAYGQAKPTVTVVNPVSNPVNTRITNAVVPVEISNADAIPVTAQESEGRRQIYSKLVSVTFDVSVVGCNGNDPVTVPIGKRLVVEYLSALSTLNAPIQLVAVWLERVGGNIIAVAPATSTATGDGISFSAAGQYVHAYADGNLSVCAMSSGANSESLDVYVTGYLVDKP
jgi:hypothetical protein